MVFGVCYIRVFCKFPGWSLFWTTTVVHDIEWLLTFHERYHVLQLEGHISTKLRCWKKYIEWLLTSHERYHALQLEEHICIDDIFHSLICMLTNYIIIWRYHCHGISILVTNSLGHMTPPDFHVFNGSQGCNSARTLEMLL